MPGMHQIEHSIGEDDGTTHPFSPGHRFGDGAYLLRRMDHVAGESRGPNSSFNAGGATKVVTMTMRRMAPNTASLRTPARRPISAKMSPTSPRGIMPTPTT